MKIVSVSFEGINRPVVGDLGRPHDRVTPWSPQSGKLYNYFCQDSLVSVGDKVVVDSPTSGYTIVEVKEVREKLYDDRAAKWVVCRVNDEAYRQRLAGQQRREAILKVLETKAKKVEESQKYRHLAAHDEDARALLAELDQLEGRAPQISASVVPSYDDPAGVPVGEAIGDYSSADEDLREELWPAPRTERADDDEDGLPI